MHKRLSVWLVAILLVAGLVGLSGCPGVPPTTKPPETSTNPPEKKEEKKEEAEKKTESAEEKTPITEIGRAGELQITQIAIFPSNRIVPKTGRLAVVLYLRNPHPDKTVSEEVSLLLDGGFVNKQTATVPAGATTHLYFWLSEFDKAGERVVTVGGQEIRFTVVEAQPARGGELPPDAQVLAQPEGMSEPGLPGGKLVVGTIVGPKTLNPVVANETSSTDVTGLLHAGLVETRWEDYKPTEGLAHSWEISDDRREIVFHLRRGIRWSDGHCCFTADDVLFTFNDLHFNPDVRSAGRDLLYVEGQPLQFVKLDDYTVKVIMPKPFRPILNSLGFVILPKHKLADKVAKLNPGAKGYYDGAKKLIEENREELRGISAERASELERRLQTLGAAIAAKDLEKTQSAAAAVRESLDALKNAVPEEKAQLIDLLQQAVDNIQKSVEFAQATKWEGVPPTLFNTTWGLGTPAEEIVGLGPYRFVRYDVDQQVVLERNPYYWKIDPNGVQLPYLDQFVFLVVQNLDTAFLKFKTGETDTLGVRPSDWPLLMQEIQDLDRDCEELPTGNTICVDLVNNRELLRGGPTFGESYLAFNQDVAKAGPGKPFYEALQAVFRSLQFRRAIAHAVDKESIINNIFNGLAIPQWSPVSIPSPFYDKSESFTKYEYDLEKAARMLDEIGLRDIDNDGVRNITDEFLKNFANPEDRIADLSKLPPERDRELEFLLTTNQGNQIREKIVSVLVNDLAKIGVKANARSIEFNTLVDTLFNGTFEAMVLGLTGGTEPNNGSNVWKINGRLHFWRYSSKENPPDWEKRVDELFDLAATTFDEEEAKEYYKEFQRLVSENLPYIYLVNQQYIYASKATLGNNDNFKPNFSVLAFADQLWWKDEQRRNAK
ncbi:MAG: ABC transporter substrate-binding protein [Candidatus Bipolaricaulota bacterium]|nr:ABC transporter substrate-binding protein [Candidatus Bipolaricaulota bacterium]MDW8110142.1 ABC transporter substrate-binding protein [Candidatus Bipolaricaulota bacterium]MDW8329647.1 ABC transporter substrate-binding protein [Candidatus Bipolaricaulota bacterium]